MLHRRLAFALMIPPLLFIGVFLLYPLARIIGASLTLDALDSIWSRPYFLKVISFTLGQALLSTILTLLVALPGAYLFARFSFPGKTLLRALITVPFVMPTVVVAAAFRALLGTNGLLNALLTNWFSLASPPIRLERTLAIILFAHVFYNVSVVVRLVGGLWSNLNPSLEEAASVLGASRWRVFTNVTLPTLMPALQSASLLVFLFTFTSFGVVLLLGGPAYSTLETEIYRQYVTYLNRDVAALLSLVQIGFTLVVMSVYARWQRRSALPLDLSPSSVPTGALASARERLWIGVYALLLTLFLLAPLVTLAWRSLVDQDGHLTLVYYRSLSEARRGSVLFIPPLQAIRNSVGYGLVTVLLGGLLGLMSATWLSRPRRGRGILDPLFMLPLGTSAVTLGFGYVISLRALRTSPLLVLFAHVLVALPFVVRALLPILQGIQPVIRDAAATLGASPARVWREIDLPLVGRALLVGCVFAFTVSIGEFGATSFIVRPNSGFLTMPIAIQRFLSQPGALNLGQALAMSTLLMLVCIISFVVIERFRYSDIGEF